MTNRFVPEPHPDDLDPQVPPYVVAYASGRREERFMFAPEQGIGGFTFGNDKGHARVYRFGPDEVAAMQGMDFAQRLAYVSNLDLDRLTMVEERGTPQQPFDPSQLALF